MTSSQPQARFLMCRPAHFAVTYAINPWMDPENWARNDHALGAAAWQEWAALHQTLRDPVEATFGVEVVAMELVDPRFYHLDTALSAMPRGEVIYFPGAFTAAARAAIRERVDPADRIELTAEDACRLSANAVVLDDTIVLPGCGGRLRAELEQRGYCVRKTPLGAFLRSGGAAFCLTLRLDARSHVESRLVRSSHQRLPQAQARS